MDHHPRHAHNLTPNTKPKKTQHRTTEKVARKASLLELAGLLSQLRTSQRAAGRPLFVPPAGLGDRELSDQAWVALEAAEQVCCVCVCWPLKKTRPCHNDMT